MDKSTDIEKDIRMLKRDNFILVILVSILFCLVILLFDRVDGINTRIDVMFTGLGYLSEIIQDFVMFLDRFFNRLQQFDFSPITLSDGA